MTKRTKEQCISHAALAELEATAKRTHRLNWAFNKGGSFDVVTLEGCDPIGVVADPSLLSEEQLKEISAAIPLTIESQSRTAAQAHPLTR